MQRRAAIANAMAYHEAYGLGWQSWADYDDAIRAVTAGRRRGRGGDATCATIARSPRPSAAVRDARRHDGRGRRAEAPPRHGSNRLRGRVASVGRRSRPRGGHGDLGASLVLIFPLLLAYEIGVLFAGRSTAPTS